MSEYEQPMQSSDDELKQTETENYIENEESRSSDLTILHILLWSSLTLALICFIKASDILFSSFNQEYGAVDVEYMENILFAVACFLPVVIILFVSYCVYCCRYIESLGSSPVSASEKNLSNMAYGATMALFIVMILRIIASVVQGAFSEPRFVANSVELFYNFFIIGIVGCVFLLVTALFFRLAINERARPLTKKLIGYVHLVMFAGIIIFAIIATAYAW